MHKESLILVETIWGYWKAVAYLFLFAKDLG
jgi:hypothetical protein